MNEEQILSMKIGEDLQTDLREEQEIERREKLQGKAVAPVQRAIEKEK